MSQETLNILKIKIKEVELLSLSELKLNNEQIKIVMKKIGDPATKTLKDYFMENYSQFVSEIPIKNRYNISDLYSMNIPTEKLISKINPLFEAKLNLMCEVLEIMAAIDIFWYATLVIITIIFPVLCNIVAYIFDFD